MDLAATFGRATRNIRGHMASSVVVVVTLALASGPLTVALSLMSPHANNLGGIADPTGLVRISSRFAATSAAVQNPLSYPEFIDLERGTHALASIAAVYREGASVRETDEVGARVALVTGNYFAVMGAAAQRGRPIMPSDDAPDATAPIVVLSDDFWRSAFGDRSDIVGQTIRLNGALVVVVGVARKGFTGSDLGDPVDVWIPLSTHAGFPNVPPLFASRADHVFTVIGRLRPGARVVDAATEVAYAGGQLDAAYPDSLGPRKYAASPLPVAAPPHSRSEGDDLGFGMWLLVALVLAVACFNIAGMFLARAVTEQQKTAVRLALGSGIRRLATDAFVESLMLSAVGLTVGALFAVWVFKMIAAYADPAVLGMSLVPRLDWRVFGCAAAIGVCTAAAFVLLPLTHWRRIDLANALKVGHHSARRETRNARDLLIVLQFTLAIVVTVSAATLGRTVQHLRSVDPGFKTAGLVSVSMGFRNVRKAPAIWAITSQTLTAAANAVPGVRAAGIGVVPLFEWDMGFVVRVQSDATPGGEEFRHDFIGPGYLHTLGATILEGRDFDASDGPSAPTRVIVNASMARLLWPTGSAIGRRITLSEPSRPADVIGVVNDFVADFVGRGAEPRLFESAAQNNLVRGFMYARVDDAHAAAALRARLATLLGPGSGTPVVRTAEEGRESGMTFMRDAFPAAAMLGGIALLVAIVGLYGMLSHTVAQRTQEIGIRIALGASRGGILSLVVSHALRLTVLAAVIAIPCAAGVVHLIRSIIYGSGVLDPVVVAAAVALLALATVAASFTPALLAIRIDPLAAIRSD